MILFFSYIWKFFIFIEKSICCWKNLALVNSPCFTKWVHNILFTIHYFYSSLLSYIIKSHNSIWNSLTLNNFYPPDFCSAITMSSTTCFSVNTLNVYYSQRISRNNSTLIKTESVYFLSFSFIHKAFANFTAWINNSICLIFNFSFFFFC